MCGQINYLSVYQGLSWHLWNMATGLHEKCNTGCYPQGKHERSSVGMWERGIWSELLYCPKVCAVRVEFHHFLASSPEDILDGPLQLQWAALFGDPGVIGLT